MNIQFKKQIYIFLDKAFFISNFAEIFEHISHRREFLWRSG